MKFGHIVKAGLIAGAFASTAQAQSLTGTINGVALNSASGVVGACDIGLGPIMGGRSCSFSNSFSGLTNVQINGTATMTFDVGLNAYIYRLGYSYSGAVTAAPNQVANVNAQFAFNVPLWAQTWDVGSSSINTSVTIRKQTATLTADGSLASFVTSDTYLAGNPTGSFGMNLNPAVAAFQPITGVPLTVSDMQSSGPNAVNTMFDQNVVSFGFDLMSVPDRAWFDGQGYVEFTNVVPEPSTYALFATGLVGLIAAARRRRSV